MTIEQADKMMPHKLVIIEIFRPTSKSVSVSDYTNTNNLPNLVVGLASFLQ